ncbi:MAG TPA: restriction endonuclease subunit S [Bacteroidia bacterium]|nr:restriction endonuclease subunit S [Bacteroidia bacterium]
MKLNKHKWGSVKLSEVCEKTQNVDIRKQSGIFSYIDIGSINSDAKRVSEVQMLNWSEASSRARQIIHKGDTLFSTVRVNLERIAFIDKEIPNAIASTGFTVIRANKKALPEFLFYSTSSPEFIERLCKLQKGTAYPAVSDRIVFNEVIPLPSLAEQKQIAELFQSIEAAMEQVEGQERNLRTLQKSLVNGLVGKKPVFGDLLNAKNCTPTTFGEIAECDKKYPEHELEAERFVGLENIEADNFQLLGYGLVANGTTFSKRFCTGDVLFGKRRAYLKKVAVADFNGICSGDILVIRAKAKKMLQGLLPYYISADAFIQHAVSTSAGSLSPRTKWKDLADFEISIPDIKTQEKILAILSQFDNTINQLKQQKVTLKNLKQKLLNEILG